MMPSKIGFLFGEKRMMGLLYWSSLANLSPVMIGIFPFRSVINHCMQNIIPRKVEPLPFLQVLPSPTQADTARVIWSFNPSDPTSSGMFSRHTQQGSASLNLLGGLPSSTPDPDDLMTYDILVENVSVLA